MLFRDLSFSLCPPHHVQVKLASFFSAGLLERMVAVTEALLATLGDTPAAVASPAAEASNTSFNRSGTKLGSRAPDPDVRGDRKQGEIMRFSSPIPSAKPTAASPQGGVDTPGIQISPNEQSEVAPRGRDTSQRKVSNSFHVGGQRLMGIDSSYLHVSFCPLPAISWL